MYVPALHNQPEKYEEGVINWLEGAIEGPQPSEKEMLEVCHEGAGYNKKRGVMLLNTEKMEPPPSMQGDAIEEHLMGIVLTHQFSLKKGLELFGEVAENAAKAEIQQYMEMDCYQPLDEKRVDKKGRVACADANQAKNK